MNSGRFGIKSLLVLVVVAALEFWSIRALNDLSFQFYVNGSPLVSRMIGALIIGAIPMANILAFGLLIYLRGQRKLRFFLGFETFGAVALAIYISGLVLFANELVPFLSRQYETNLLPHFQDGPFVNTAGIISMISIMIAILTLPQVAFALLGGLLFQTVANHASRSQAGSGPSDNR